MTLQAILNDYITFWYEGGGNPFSYTNWIGWAAWQRYKLNGNQSFIAALVPNLVKAYKTYPNKFTAYAGKKRCWFQTAGSDAMEVSISGDGCRPTLASAIWGEATAVSLMANQTNQTGAALPNEASFSQSVVLDLHWNPKIDAFATIPGVKRAPTPSPPPPTGSPATTHKRLSKSPGEERQAPGNMCDLNAIRVPNEPVNARELLSFMPWYFSDGSDSAQLIPADRYKTYAGMFRELTDPQGYAAKWGLTTAEQRSACFNYSWSHGDCWNQNSWPYETARVLTSLANVMNDYPNGEETVSRSVYGFLLTQYARQHTRTTAANDTAVPLGSGHVFENLHPFLGYWNNRERMYWRNDKNKNMGDDYNHSTFNDLILSGLLGLRPQKGNTILINPLVEWSKLTHFAVDHVLIKGKILTVFYDADGTKYNKGVGLTVMVDGKVAATATNLPLPKPLEVPI